MKSKILCGDALQKLKELPDKSIQCCVTSPPYWGLRNYGVRGQIGEETHPRFFIAALSRVFKEVWRVLKDDGTLWLNLGDTYAAGGHGGGGSFDLDGTLSKKAQIKKPRKAPHGFKRKELIGIPWRVAFKLQEAGWYLRSDIIWAKPNPTPESVQDRPTKSHEYIFLMTKNEKYKYNGDAIKEPLSADSIMAMRSQYRGQSQKDYLGAKAQNPSDIKRRMIERWLEKLDAGEPIGANKKSVWHVGTPNCRGEHFATYPEELIKPCILAGSDPGDTILDPFNGTGTTGLVSLELGRNYVGCEINPDYVKMTQERLKMFQPDLFERVLTDVSNQTDQTRPQKDT